MLMMIVVHHIIKIVMTASYFLLSWEILAEV